MTTMISDESGVKHFDRNFVAANLQSLLHCPKCFNDFTFLPQGPRHRPFLLPCGHNLCEDCISKDRKNLECAVCFSPAPLAINSNDPNSKFGVNILDYYELNYHVLGKLNSLHYLRRISYDSVNKLLAISSNTDINVDTKCNECGQNVATGQCAQCNASYCKRCFDAVHLNSRVLKAHQFQRLSDIKKSNSVQSFRVGNKSFAMPFNAICSVHNSHRNIFCTHCNRTKCEQCIAKFHQAHLVRPLTEMNLQYIDQIPSYMSLIESALLNVRNSQQVVKNSKQKLGDYATETLAKISKHFCHLHGQLQMAELQVIEKLRESSLSPQMKLHEATNNLNGYETVLMHLTELFENKNQFGVPKDIWLKELLSLTTQHLKRIPNGIEVSKIDINPYKFRVAAQNNLKKLFEKHFECDFTEPKLVVRFQNDFDRDGSISSISNDVIDSTFFRSSSSGKENKKQQAKANSASKSQMDIISQRSHKQIRNQKRLSKKGSKRNTSIKSNSSLEEIHSGHKNLESMRTTFSVMDISKANTKTSMDVTHNRDWFKSDIMVKVRSVNSPEDFYVQGVHAIHRLQQEIEAFAQTPECQPPIKIVVGEHYIIYHTAFKRYHRALVSKKLKLPDTYNVILPDIGLQFPVNIKNFRELPKSLAIIPYSAVHCTLKQLMPNNGIEWDNQASAFLKQVVQNNPVHVTMVRDLGGNFYEVDLITTNYGTNISVRESFLYTGLARARFGNAYADAIKPKQLRALNTQRLPLDQVKFGDAFMAQILHLESPQEFYVMRYDKEDLRIELQQSLQNIMDRMGLAQLENIYLGRLQLGCALQLEGQWHRARIEQTLPDGYVLARLVDNGTCQKVYWDQLFALPSKFKICELAIKCCLADVETLPEHGYVWTPEAINSFKQLTSNPKLHVEVIGVCENINHVALSFIRPSGESISVGAELVKLNHCKSIGESSRLLKPPSPRPSRLDMSTRKFIKEQKSLSTMPLEVDQDLDGDQVVKRVSVHLVYIKDPHEFYVTLSHFLPAIEDLKISIQETATEIYENSVPHDNWIVGDMCYVHFQAHSDNEFRWHRGQVQRITFSLSNDIVKYDILLRDIGEVAENIPSTHLININETHMRISNSVIRCHLHDVHPKRGENWPSLAIEFFKDQLQAYQDLLVTDHGRKNNSVAVVLWGSHREIPGPFSLERVKYVNINDMIVMAALASKDKDKSAIQSVSGDNEDPELTWKSWALNKCFDDIDLMPNLGKHKTLTNESYRCLTPPPFKHTDEMPPLDLLKDLNMLTPTTGQTSAPLAWTQSRKCEKTIFTAFPTNVNYECQIYLSLSNDKPFMENMRKLLEKCCRPKMNRSNPEVNYVVGQPVVVTYHLDNSFYRGIVEKLPNLQGEYVVYYVDYGNVEMVLPSEMLPYAPFPQLKAMCWLVDIYGVRPKNKKYTIKEIDTVHKEVVMKLSGIRVIDKNGPNNVPMCQINVNSHDIATMMIGIGMAVSTLTNRLPNEEPKENNRLLESFNIFDELLHFGESVKDTEKEYIQSPALFQDKNNSTIKPPPNKKPLLHYSEEIIEFDSDPEDFDCKQAALDLSINADSYGWVNGVKSMVPQRNRINNGNEGEESDNVYEHMSISYANSDRIDHILEMESPAGITASNFDATETNVMKPHTADIMNQLRRRVEFRHKDMLNKVRFSPLDTSTVFLYNAESCFKPQSLPTGVNHFLCTIDSIISATELQISPCLTEFTKCDISLFQETCALIEEAAPLHPEVDALCLAQYSKDKQWYRATITELHVATKRAAVFYIDFHDTELVEYANLKVMPKQLFTFPLRSFRVKLHKVKLNKNFGEKTVRQALQACLCDYAYVYARVYYPVNYHSNKGRLSNDNDLHSSNDVIRRGYRLLEVELFENKHKQKLLYKPLIESCMYV